MLPLLLALSAQADPFERDIEHALLVQVPPQGLRRIGDAVEAVLPNTFSVLETADAFECSDDTAINYVLAPLDLLLTVDDVALVPGQDRLDIQVFATLGSSASTLTATGDCALFEDLDETCDLQLPTTALQVDLGIDLVVQDGMVEATASPVALTISPIGNPVDNCLLASAIGTALGQNPSLIDDLVTDAVTPALADLPAQAEEAIEDALNSFVIDTDLSLAGAELGLSLQPERLEFTDDGFVVGLSAEIAGSDTAPCAPLDGLVVPQTAWPVLGPTAPDTSLRHDAGVFIGTDFVQELLTSAWATGLLCQEIREFNGSQLTGGVVNAFFGGAVLDVIEEDTPAVVVLASDVPPMVYVDEDQPVVRVDLDGLRLDLAAEVDGRLTRLAEIGIVAEAGLDLSITDGRLEPILAVDSDAFRFEETYSELLPPGYSQGLDSLLGTVLGGLLPTEALASIVLPTPLGIDFDEPLWKPTADGDWLGVFLRRDLSSVQRIQPAGCSATALGCGDSGGGIEFDVESALGCDDPANGCGEGSGCTHGTVFIPMRPLMAVLLLGPFIARRRRHRAAEES